VDVWHKKLQTGLRDKEVVIMYNGERDNDCASKGSKCEGRSCVRRVRKNGRWSCLCVARWLYAKLTKDGNMTVNSVVSIVQNSMER
jgi:hypothetical protein